MKQIITVVVCLAIAALGGIWITKRNAAPVPPPASAVAETPDATAAPPKTTKPVASHRSQPTPAAAIAVPEQQAASVGAVAEPITAEVKEIRESVERLVSTKTAFHDKYLTWTKLRDSGRLPQVINALEQLATNHPTAAAYPAALGQAYIHQIATTQDPRQHALMGLKADQSFDAAMDIDPKFWEARFFKALSMSYWPAEMNKGSEVVTRFTQLIEDQEAQGAKPEFAQSYVWLGEQYRKSGRSDYADQVWRRGAALYPAEPMLQEKLNTPK